MEIEYVEEKRRKILEERGLDLARAEEVFDGAELSWVDDRQDYGETRWSTFGLLDERLVAVSWTIRNAKRRIISMRKANDREKARYRQTLD